MTSSKYNSEMACLVITFKFFYLLISSAATNDLNEITLDVSINNSLHRQQSVLETSNVIYFKLLAVALLFLIWLCQAFHVSFCYSRPIRWIFQTWKILALFSKYAATATVHILQTIVQQWFAGLRKDTRIFYSAVRIAASLKTLQVVCMVYVKTCCSASCFRTSMTVRLAAPRTTSASKTKVCFCRAIQTFVMQTGSTAKFHLILKNCQLCVAEVFFQLQRLVVRDKFTLSLAICSLYAIFSCVFYATRNSYQSRKEMSNLHFDQCREPENRFICVNSC